MFYLPCIYPFATGETDSLLVCGEVDLRAMLYAVTFFPWREQNAWIVEKCLFFFSSFFLAVATTSSLPSSISFLALHLPCLAIFPARGGHLVVYQLLRDSGNERWGCCALTDALFCLALPARGTVHLPARLRPCSVARQTELVHDYRSVRDTLLKGTEVVGFERMVRGTR